ncbi:outer membrane beta-barrel protein [Dokdonia ponticola]|uniref:Outer membrane beta-barrel protein n=1 Tax=Dokdonia ponticola TaxID=2041041 RepID=A0ABV9HTU0_9FLAO
MGNRKDIGKVFNEKFKDFEQAPSADLWDTIASGLDQKNDRRIAPLWLYFGGFLIIAMLTGLLYWAPWDLSDSINGKEQPLVTNADTVTQDETDIHSSYQKEKITNTVDTNTIDHTTSETTANKNPNDLSNTNDSETTTTNNSLVSTTTDDSLSSENQKSKKSQSLATVSNTFESTKDSYNTANSDSSENQTTTSSTSYYEKKAVSTRSILNTMVSASQKIRDQKELEAKTAYEAKIKEELATAIATQKEANKIDLQKWQDSIQSIEASKKVALAVTPHTEEKTEVAKAVKLPKTQEERENDRKESVNYKFAISPYTSLLSYGSLSKGSSIDNRLVDNPRDAVSTIGYGIRADYKLSEKSSIRFGIGVAPLQYRTDDFQVLITNNNVNIFQLSGINPQNLNQSGGGIETSPTALAFFNANDVVSIEQNISYVEVPVDYQYRFLNKRVSMSFNTGLSLFVLTNNRVFATADNGQSIFIGRETSLKDLSLAFNLGLGTYYNFSKNWRFDLEPAFKYQLNPYSDNIGNFRPYYFGLQFGVSYKF